PPGSLQKNTHPHSIPFHRKPPAIPHIPANSTFSYRDCRFFPKRIPRRSTAPSNLLPRSTCITLHRFIMAESTAHERMEKIVSLSKRRSIIFQSSEIYGSINGFWDYSPLGVELKRNLKEAWWRSMTMEREDVAGLDATIIMHPTIWKAS